MVSVRVVARHKFRLALCHTWWNEWATHAPSWLHVVSDHEKWPCARLLAFHMEPPPCCARSVVFLMVCSVAQYSA